MDPECLYKHEMMLTKLMIELKSTEAQNCSPSKPSMLFDRVVEKCALFDLEQPDTAAVQTEQNEVQKWTKQHFAES